MGKKLAIILIAVLLVLPLMACGGGGDGGGAQKPAAPAAQETRAAPTQAAAPSQPKATSPAAPKVVAPTQAAPKPQPGQAVQPSQPAGGGPNKIANVAMPGFLRIKGTSTPGSILDIVAKGLIYNIEDAFPEVRTRNVPGGTLEGVLRVDNGEVDVGVTNTSEPYMAWYGAGSYTKPIRSVRTIFQMPYISTVFFVVLDDSKITGMKDLDGKRICVGPAGYTTARLVTPAMLKLYGMSYESISSHGGSVLYTTTDVGLQMLGDGKIDVALASGIDPFGPLAALAQTKKVRILKFTDQEMAEVEKAAPGFSVGYVPAGTYKGQDDAVRVIGLGNPVVVNANMNPDIAYNLLWGIFRDNGKRYQEMHPRLAKEDLVKVAIDKLIVPLHPGAERYWKDRGITAGKTLVDTLGPPK